MTQGNKVFLCTINHTACPAYADGICDAFDGLRCDYRLRATMSDNEKSQFQSTVRTAHAARLAKLEKIAKKLDAMCDRLPGPRQIAILTRVEKQK